VGIRGGFPAPRHVQNTILEMHMPGRRKPSYNISGSTIDFMQYKHYKDTSLKRNTHEAIAKPSSRAKLGLAKIRT
jgi:hypothetical protein